MSLEAKRRLRIFAGPNGSGKSTITKIVLDYVSLGTYVNADEIKVIFTNQRFLDFSIYNISVNKEEFISAFKESSLANKIRSIPDTLSNISLEHNALYLHKDYRIEDYFVSFVTSYI